MARLVQTEIDADAIQTAGKQKAGEHRIASQFPSSRQTATYSGLPAGWSLSVGLGDLADEFSPVHIHGPIHLGVFA